MITDNKHKLYGIIGGTLSHSLSPLIHNYLFNKYKLSCHYTTFESDQSKLKDLISGVRALNISGLNVTFPYKEKLIPYLDKLDATVQKTGAVNTIKNYRGKLIGYNTDLLGIRKTLQNRLKIDLKGRAVLLLGAGGAARACLVELIRKKPDRIIVANRNISKAKAMIKRLEKSKTNSNIKVIDIKSLNDLDQREPLDLLINSTSANSSILKAIIKKLAINKYFNSTKIFDLNYGQRAIPKNHREFHNRYVDGLFMLTVQAAAGFNIWTGINVEPDDIYKYIAKKITG